MARPLPLLARAFPGVFYGWVVAVGASLLSFVTVGIGFYGLPILLDGLVQGRGWSRTEVSGATSLYFAVVALTGVLVGRGVDRLGSRGFIALGSCLMAAALLGLSRVEAPRGLFLLYPLLAVGFAASAGVPVAAMVTRWFVARRALAMAIAQTGVSVGGVVLVPFATGILDREGLAAATRTLALLAVAVPLPIVLFVLRFDPASHGLEPDGGPPARAVRAQWRPEVQRRVWGRREALATRAFWLLAAGFSLVLFGQQAVGVHLLSFLREPLGAERAALAVSTLAGASIVGRLAVGSFADRVEQRRVAVALVLVQAGAYALLGFGSGPLAWYAGAAALGLTIGNLFMFQSLLVGELFGATSFGTVQGMLVLVTQVLGGLGPLALGALAESSASYAPALRGLAGLALVGALLLARVRPSPQIEGNIPRI
jgi:MFS family permease